MIEFDKVIRDTKVTIHAARFVGDSSVGIPLGPDELWATTEDGEEFELTDDEITNLSIEATEIYIEDVGP